MESFYGDTRARVSKDHLWVCMRCKWQGSRASSRCDTCGLRGKRNLLKSSSKNMLRHDMDQEGGSIKTLDLFYEYCPRLLRSARRWILSVKEEHEQERLIYSKVLQRKFRVIIAQLVCLSYLGLGTQSPTHLISCTCCHFYVWAYEETHYTESTSIYSV